MLNLAINYLTQTEGEIVVYYNSAESAERPHPYILRMDDIKE